MDHYGLKYNKINADGSQLHERKFNGQLVDIRTKLNNDYDPFSLIKSSSTNRLSSLREPYENRVASDQKVVIIKTTPEQFSHRTNYLIDGAMSTTRHQSKDQIQNKSSSPTSNNRQRQNIKKRKVIPFTKIRQLPVHYQYSEKMELHLFDAQIQRHFQIISNNVNSLIKYINNKKQVYKLLNRLLDNYNSIKTLLLNVETAELSEPFNVNELNKRLLEKSYTIYHFLVDEVKNQASRTNPDYRLSFHFTNSLLTVSDQISELYQQKVEEKMAIMSDNIIKEWGAVQYLHAKLVRKQFQTKTKKINLNFDYSYDTLPVLHESDKIENIEVLHGQLSYISKQQRSYNKKIYEVLTKVRSQNNNHNFNINISR